MYALSFTRTTGYLMVLFISIGLIFLSNEVKAGNNYYFSSSTGDDNRTNIQAQNPSTPWKTLSKLNSYFSSLLPGDSVLLKKGDIFYGSIRINKSGTATQPIVIGAYGSGDKPIITGLKEVTGWTDVGGNIWESSVTVCKSTLNLVTIDGKIAQIGRYPNAGTFLTYESFSGTASITDNQLSGTPNWTGAEVYIRNNGYGGQRRTITNHVGTTITYAGGNNYDMKSGFGYFIQNDVRTLDADKEWYFNPITKKISMYFADNNPAFPKDVPFVISLLSITVTLLPLFCKQYADISPIQPPPTITTSFFILILH